MTSGGVWRCFRGQQFAQQIGETNPELVEQLRQSMGQVGTDDATQQPQPPPPSQPDSDGQCTFLSSTSWWRSIFSLIGCIEARFYAIPFFLLVQNSLF